MSNRIIDLGKARSNFNKDRKLTAHDRALIETKGTRAQKRKLKRKEAKEGFLFDATEDIAMKMTLKSLNHPHFISAMQKLDNCTRFPTPQVAWNVMKVLKQAHTAIQENRALYQKMTKEYVELDEKNEIKLGPDGDLAYKTPEGKAEHEAKLDEMMKIEIEIVGKPFDLNTLGVANLSPYELEALEAIIDPATVEA